jgi:hypothetical protein
MANIKISQLTPKGANLASTDLLEISESAGGGAYVTKSVTGAQIVAAGGGVTSVSGTAPIASTGGTTPTISIATANTSTTGALTSTDWNTFNGKQAALVSGTNIKTINGNSVLGSGDLTISGGPRKYVNNTLQTASISAETLVGSYLIPANTFASNGSFEFLIKAGASSGLSSLQAKLYINTSNTLTGATLLATSTNNAGGGYFNFLRNAFISSNVISTLGTSLASNSDILSNGFAQSTITFDVTANRYLLVSLTPSSGGVPAEIRGVKFLQYES